MAEIQEYLPQVAAPEAIGAVNQNIELSGAVGRSFERAGDDLTQGALFVQRRAAQRESAQVYAHISDLTNDIGQQVQSGIQDGSLDQEKVLKNFDDANQKLSENLSTPQAQNYLTRLQSRFRGHLMRTMSVGMAQIASQEAQGQMLDARNKSGNAIFEDPASFKDQYEAGVEDIDQRIQTGGLPEKMRQKATDELGQTFAKQAIRGWANLDTDKARALLNGDPTKNQSPAFDNFLTPDQKFQLNKEIDSRDRANDIEDKREQRTIQDAQKAKAEKWSSDNFQKWTDNSLSIKDVTGAVKNGTLTAEQGEKWVHLINERQKDNDKPNHALFNNLSNRIADPSNPNPITKIEDVMPFVGKGITPTQFASLTKLFNQTPEEKANAQGEKSLFDAAKKTIPFKNMMTGQYDVRGEEKLAQMHADYAQAKQKLRESGGNVSDLTNPNSKDYFGNNLSKYQTSMSDQLQVMHQDRTDKALGLKPTNANPDGTPAKQARQPNESAADYLKRIGK